MAVAALGLAALLFDVGGSSSGVRIVAVVVTVAIVLVGPGFVVVKPNEARVLILFGRYVGTLTEARLWWVNPFTVFWRERISLRVRNFQSERIKVNDLSGNPIEIAAVVVWRVTDTAKAVFDVADFEQFVTVQSETSLRHLANQYPYDDYSQQTTSLRGNADEVRDGLQAELQERLRDRRNRDPRNEAHASRLRTRDRRGDAPPPAGRGDPRRAPDDGRRRRGSRTHGARATRRFRPGRARPRAQGHDGRQPDGRAVGRPFTDPGDQHRLALQLKRTDGVPESKRFLLRLDPRLFEALRHWAQDDLRSINAQIEFLLSDQARRAGRLPHRRTRPPQPPESPEPEDDDTSDAPEPAPELRA